MKRILIFLLLNIPMLLFAQQPASVHRIGYDTLSVHDVNAYNIEDVKIFNKLSHKLYRAGKLLNGKKEGIWRTYYENGVLNRVEEFHADVQNGMLLMFETNGSLQREQYSKNGALDGILHQYSGGILKLEEVYESGKLNGWRRVFAEDGTLQEEGMWRNGQRDSINRWFYPGGKLNVTYTYQSGTITGPSKSYYESEKVKSEGNYLNNLEEGFWKEYYESENLSAEGIYTLGTKSGDWKIYDEDGNLIKTESYQNGSLTKGTSKKK